jgi:hypothetical protein
MGEVCTQVWVHTPQCWALLASAKRVWSTQDRTGQISCVHLIQLMWSCGLWWGRRSLLWILLNDGQSPVITYSVTRYPTNTSCKILPTYRRSLIWILLQGKRRILWTKGCAQRIKIAIHMYFKMYSATIFNPILPCTIDHFECSLQSSVTASCFDAFISSLAPSCKAVHVECCSGRLLASFTLADLFYCCLLLAWVRSSGVSTPDLEPIEFDCV